MAARQTFYKRFTKMIETSENHFTLDFSEADKQNAPEDLVGKDIYMNVAKPLYLSAADDSCAVELWREANDFNTYRITRRGAFANIISKG